MTSVEINGFREAGCRDVPKLPRLRAPPFAPPRVGGARLFHSWVENDWLGCPLAYLLDLEGLDPDLLPLAICGDGRHAKLQREG